MSAALRILQGVTAIPLRGAANALLRRHTLLDRSFLRRTLFAITAFGLTGLALGAPAAVAGGGHVHVVVVKDFEYTDDMTGTPVTLAHVGSTVRFEWESGLHTVTSGVAARRAPELGGMNSPILGAGSAYEFTPSAPGAYPYTCRVHSNMNGVVIVS